MRASINFLHCNSSVLDVDAVPFHVYQSALYRPHPTLHLPTDKNRASPHRSQAKEKEVYRREISLGTGGEGLDEPVHLLLVGG
jgi:hypothetical protein